jgi:hypothetical protein
MPILLGYLTEQVPRSEVGAMQGAADTVRTVASMIGSPLLSRAFGHFISEAYTGGTPNILNLCILNLSIY